MDVAKWEATRFAYVPVHLLAAFALALYMFSVFYAIAG